MPTLKRTSKVDWMFCALLCIVLLLHLFLVDRCRATCPRVADQKSGHVHTLITDRYGDVRYVTLAEHRKIEAIDASAILIALLWLRRRVFNSASDER
jgi:hypothetical protein